MWASPYGIAEMVGPGAQLENVSPSSSPASACGPWTTRRVPHVDFTPIVN